MQTVNITVNPVTVILEDFLILMENVIVNLVTMNSIKYALVFIYI